MRWGERALIAAAAAPCGLALAFASGLLAVPKSAPAAASVVVLLGVAPVLEEIVFRGGLHAWLFGFPVGRVVFGVVSSANIATSAVFALVHAALRHDLAALSTGVASLLLGWVYEADERLWPVIALHAYFNALWLAATLLG